MSKRPLPVPTDETKPFWNALSEGRISLQFCPECATTIHPPLPVCPHCLSAALEWHDHLHALLKGCTKLWVPALQGRPLPQTIVECRIGDATLVVLDEASVTDGARPDARLRLGCAPDADGRLWPIVEAVEPAS